MLLIKFVDKLNKVMECLAGFALALMTAVVFVQVFVRFVLGELGIQASVPWTEELARYLMIWAIFIGAAVAARRVDSLAVEILIQVVPPSAGKILKLTAYLFVLVFYVCIFFVGLEMAQFGFSEKAPVLKVPMVYVYSAMSIGAALTILNTVTSLIDIYVNKKDILDTSDEEINAEVEAAIEDYKKNRKEIAV
ncbi:MULTISPECIES: TRAP transporter small permease [Paenibacillus]|uniref:DctQ component of tripartite ATP-independent periplasmic transporter n=1 Tax=Paenibacillus naphthalenovorans TaxID=162209 RepID=A0A0U2VZM2_9BACL|nr:MULTISPECIES: TRAP transporter small permease [Paenibacillus]ALS24919.1 DctQ component of tripartite ATP-independent periplasmic transporter [Paenibacillus naphthalenovorans]NTZ19236.1 TRAP transporter small permease [Paenibacillus sp. JMULE4]GCL74150.1 TRAP transporter small permease [Paenibacillus naphthalenovorans]SDJ52151.1 TRAP-type C4-dicarboxylate transport system, small permease component [Paenibacillus naphthalenovorans]